MEAKTDPAFFENELVQVLSHHFIGVLDQHNYYQISIGR